MHTFWIVLRKELLDVFRDHRTLFIAFFIGPVLMPALMSAMLYMMVSKEIEKAEQALEVAMIGAEHAPNLVKYLGTLNIVPKAAPDDPTAAILNADETVIIKITPEFADAWRRSAAAPLTLLFDSSRQDTHATLMRVKAGIQSYSSQVGSTRLLLRGISPGIVRSIRVDAHDLATPHGRSSAALSFIPYFLIIGTFLGGAYVAMDATAGERERKSLEPLLATPSSREAIMSGKLSAAALFGIMSTVLTLLMFMLAFAALPQKQLGLSITLNFSMIFRLLLLCVPIAVMGSTVLTWLSARAKSMKEAQSHMSWLMLVPMLPMIYLMMNPAKVQWWQLLVPILGENQLIMRILRAEPVSAGEWVLCVISTLLLAAIIWRLAVKMYHREQLAIAG